MESSFTIKYSNLNCTHARAAVHAHAQKHINCSRELEVWLLEIAIDTHTQKYDHK